MHVFEQAGLGTAPFRLVGHEEITFQAYPGAPIKAGGSCDYCFTAIRDAYWIQGSDGRKFKVGCDCVRKTGDTKLAKTVDAKARKIKSAAKKAKDAAKLANAQKMLDDNPDLLTDTPHPKIPGKTERDYAEWMLRYAGNAGKLKVASIILKAAVK